MQGKEYRKNTSSPVMRAAAAKHGKRKHFGAHGNRCKNKQGGVAGADGDVQEIELNPDQLAALFASMQGPDGGDGSASALLGPSASTKSLGTGGEPVHAARRAKAEAGGWMGIAHGARNGVVKILAQTIEFDWENPFRRISDAQAIGTGVFVDKRGILVTNAHVVEDAHKIWVTVPSEGERRFNARVIGVCFDVDLAVVQVEDAPVQFTFEFGDSNAVQYGQEVLTLGYPLGMDSLKLTEGIISGRQEGLFQTDAPLNPGNSGGPMLNDKGQVVGINVSIVQSSNNVGFAIPIFHLQVLWDQLTSRKPEQRLVHKPVFGVETSNANDALLEFSGVTSPQTVTGKDGKEIEVSPTGVYLRKVYENFPCHNAGMRQGDILHRFNGYQLDNFGAAEVPWSPYARASLDSLVELLSFDSKCEVVYSREGKMMVGEVTFEDKENLGMPILPPVREWHPPYEKPDYEIIFGMVVAEMTLNHIKSLHENSPSGTVIKHLTPYLTDFDLQLKRRIIISSILLGSELNKVDVFDAGTVLDEVNGKKVTTLAEFRSAVVQPVNKDGHFYVTLKSNDNELVVLPLRSALREDIELSQMYMYDESALVRGAVAKDEAMLEYVFQGDPTGKKSFVKQLKQVERLQQLQNEEDEDDDDDDDEYETLVDAKK